MHIPKYIHTQAHIAMPIRTYTPAYNEWESSSQIITSCWDKTQCLAVWKLLEHLRPPDKTLSRLQTIYCPHAHSTFGYRVDLCTPKSGVQLWSYRAGITPDLPSIAGQKPSPHREGKRKLALPRDGHKIYRCTSGRDSDLEAFSPNPSDGSFAPLAFQPGTYTKYLNLRFLSY